jgi:hypothetical protein
MSTIKRGKLSIYYNLNEILKDIKNLEWNEMYEKVNTSPKSLYRLSEKEFNKLKNNFLEEIKSIKKEDFEDFLFKKADITEDGEFDMRKDQTIFSSKIPMYYSDEYCSHSYQVPGIRLSLNHSRHGTLEFDEFIEE